MIFFKTDKRDLVQLLVESNKSEFHLIKDHNSNYKSTIKLHKQLSYDVILMKNQTKTSFKVLEFLIKS
jgi:hypothetical protein